MKDFEKELLLYKILSGKTIVNINSTRLDVVTPSLDLLYEANLIYKDYYLKTGVKNKEEIRNTLVQLGIITSENLSFLEKSTNIIQNLQKELFINFNSPNADSIRSLIKQTRNEVFRIFEILAKYETFSLEGLANYAKTIFLIKNTTYKNGKKFNFKHITITNVLSEIQKSNCSADEIRDISKSSTWSNIWFGLKGSNIFKNGVGISIDQQLLLVWSKLYDNIRENPECPNDAIIEDNDALDGWLLLQKEENAKKAQEARSKKSYSSKLDKCSEIFVMVKTKEEADRVLNMNDASSTRIMKQRINEITSKGEVDYHNLTDIRQDLQMAYNKMTMEKVRGRS